MYALTVIELFFEETFLQQSTSKQLLMGRKQTITAVITML